MKLELNSSIMEKTEVDEKEALELLAMLSINTKA